MKINFNLIYSQLYDLTPTVISRIQRCP